MNPIKKNIIRFLYSKQELDIFRAKLKAAGVKFWYAKETDHNENESDKCICVDANDYCYKFSGLCK